MGWEYIVYVFYMHMLSPFVHHTVPASYRTDVEGYFQGIFFVIQYYMTHDMWASTMMKVIEALLMHVNATSSAAATGGAANAASTAGTPVPVSLSHSRTVMNIMICYFNMAEDHHCHYLLIRGENRTETTPQWDV